MASMFENWLLDEPEAAYYSAAPFQQGAGTMFGTVPAAQRYFEGQFGNVSRQWFGDYGRQLRQGETPAVTFTQFLKDYPWTQRYTRAGRPGAGVSQFAPSIRRMY
jgi:hypothetical protein